MRRALCFIALVVFAAVGARLAVAQQETPKDSPHFSGMPNYEIWSSDEKEFDAHKFYSGKGLTNVEGRFWKKEYTLKENATRASTLQIIRNYANATRRAGGIVFVEGVCEGAPCGDFEGVPILSGKISKGKNEVWLQVLPHEDGERYELLVVEKEAMKQDVTASDLLNQLKSEGHVALYINFDTNKATIKPESQPIVDQVIQMLKDDPSLKISIEGHTDNTGTAQGNKTLSELRAKAVLDALVKGGIEQARLVAIGWGQDKPIADNGTEEGRAKNRRVELVKK